MIELQLVGYTADLRYVVFCDAAEGASRFKAPVDEDLLATLTEVVELSDPEQRRRLGAIPVVEQPPPPPPPPLPPPAPPAPPPPRAAEPASNVGVGPLAAVAVVLQQAGGQASNGDAPDGAMGGARRGSRLSPREIQALLRAGKAAGVVAKQAGVDEAWVQRWLPPIEAERQRVIDNARSARLVKSRLGASADPLGAAVDRNLAAKRVSTDEPVEWSATRRDGDPYWVVSVRYRSRGKSRRARWRYDAETHDVEAYDQHAADLAWTRAGRRATAASSAPAPAPRSRRPAAKRGTTRSVAPPPSAATPPAANPSTPPAPTPAKPAKPPAKKTSAAAKRAAARPAPAKKTSPPRGGGDSGA